VLRVALAIVYAASLDDGCKRPLVAFALAVLFDWVDGPIARRAGAETRHGALLDSGADIVFVLAATGAGAASGRLSWLVPIAIAAAATPYLVATLRRVRAHDPSPRAYSAVGHAAGVCNYALAGLLAGSVALPLPSWPSLLTGASTVVVFLNLTAVAQRLRR
jgi:phosphatidylglycerophosphate synthase